MCFYFHNKTTWDLGHPWAFKSMDFLPKIQCPVQDLLEWYNRVCPVRSGPGARTAVRSGPVCLKAYLVYPLLWFLLDRFWLPKIEKVFKFGWFKSFHFYNSDLLVWWPWFLLDRFWLPKIEKVFKFGWFKSFQFYNSDLLVWWLRFLLDRFWLPKIEKVFKFGWFKTFQFYIFDLLTLVPLGQVLAAKAFKNV